MSQYKDKVQKQIKQKAFSYVDVIYGMTIIMIILGVIFGSIRMVERRLRENQLIILADSFANKIFDEVRLRKYDENIASILDNGLTKVFDVEEGEDQGDWSSFDDIDDFHGITATDPAFPRMETSINVNYVNFDPNNKNITLSNIPTLLKRVQLDVNHPLFDNPIRYSTIIGGNFDPEILIVRAYPTDISVNLDIGEHIITAGDGLEFNVQFSEIVYVNGNHESFAFYIDIISSLLNGNPGDYSSRSSNDGEIRADYISGHGTSQLTFQLAVGPNMGGAELTDYISYRDNLIIVNGSVTDDEGNEIIYSLPNKDSANSFASHTQILPLLQQFDSKIYTTAQINQFNENLNIIPVVQSPTEIFNNWPRTERNIYFANRADAENGERWYSCIHPTRGYFVRSWCASMEWELLENPERVSQPENVSYLNTFISPDSLDKFTFEATLYSNASDDDYVGLVIAYERNKAVNCSTVGDHDPNTCTTETSINPSLNNNGMTNKFLVLMRSGNGFTPLNGDNGRFGIIYWEEHYDGGRNTTFKWSKRVFDESTERRQNWNMNRYTRVKIVRDGNIIKAWTGPFTNSRPDPNNPQYSDDYIEIDLASDRRLHKFIGKRQYGYATLSQQLSQYYDVSLVGGTVQRRDFSILVDVGNEEPVVTEYYKIDEGGSHLQQVGNLQRDLGYLRPLFNPENNNKFLLTETGIMVYPFED